MACMVGMPMRATGKACTHHSTSAHLRPSVERATDGLCRERGFSVVTGDGGFHVVTWSTVSRHGLAAVGG